MRTARAACLCLVLTACAGTADRPSPVVARNEVLARTLMTVWESGDANVIRDLFSPQAVYDDFPNQTQYQGIEEIVGYLTHVSDWADAVNVGVTDVHASEDGAVVEWTFSGIQAAPIGTRVPVATGREVVLQGVTVLEIEGGRVARAADYLDVLTFVIQLGAEVHMPGGSVLRLDDVTPGAP